MTRVALGFGQDGILFLLFPSYRFRYLKEQSPEYFSLKTHCIWFQRKMSMVNTERYKLLHNMGCVFVEMNVSSFNFDSSSTIIGHRFLSHCDRV